MSPAPARTSTDAIVAAARSLLEDGGSDAVTMQAVAAEVGVRAPSLYKRVVDRSALLRAVGDAVAADLQAAILGAIHGGDPADDLRSVADAYRRFVRGNPHGYSLLFQPSTAASAPDPTALANIGRPIVEIMLRMPGGGWTTGSPEHEADRALEAARTIVAWAHGFVDLELAGGFRLGGDLDRAYRTGVDTIIAGLSGPATRTAG